MEELALFVLPKTHDLDADCDSGGDSDDSSVSSSSIQQQSTVDAWKVDLAADHALSDSARFDILHDSTDSTASNIKMNERDVEQRGKDLRKLAVSADTEVATQIKAFLKELEENVEPTEELLRATSIGKAVNKLKLHPDRDVGQLAKDIVTKWRQTINMQKHKTGVKDGSAPPSTPEFDGKGEITAKNSDTDRRPLALSAPASGRKTPPTLDSHH
jgi:hypothetical protein